MMDRSKGVMMSADRCIARRMLSSECLVLALLPASCVLYVTNVLCRRHSTAQRTKT